MVHFCAHYYLSVGISENGNPVSDNITLNCEGVVPSNIKEGETAMECPLSTYTICDCAPPTEMYVLFDI